MKQNVKVVILCGGRGTRMREETEYRPKPLIEVGGRPILWHIMRTYAHYGFHDFILCLGYRGRAIKEYFLNYEIMTGDFTLHLNDGQTELHKRSTEGDWVVTFAETGDAAQTGSRVKQIENYIGEDLFMLTYGDGVADIDINKLIAFHRSHGKIGTVTGVHPASRFGELAVKGTMVKEFGEKPQVTEGFINGGYFVFSREIFRYLRADDDCYLEREPLENLTRDGELAVFCHEGFWQCMDTQRELEILNGMWSSGKAPWRVG